jgi:hypothetical protein
MINILEFLESVGINISAHKPDAPGVTPVDALIGLFKADVEKQRTRRPRIDDSFLR